MHTVSWAPSFWRKKCTERERGKVWRKNQQQQLPSSRKSKCEILFHTYSPSLTACRIFKHPKTAARGTNQPTTGCRPRESKTRGSLIKQRINSGQECVGRGLAVFVLQQGAPLGVLRGNFFHTQTPFSHSPNSLVITSGNVLVHLCRSFHVFTPPLLS